MKERINLDKVALIGRTYREYEKIFKLTDFDNSDNSILDVGSGVSSFCAEAREKGMNVIALDPIYIHNHNELNIKCSRDLELVINELNGVEHLYIWDVFQSKDELKKQRERAYKTFIRHYRDYKDEFYIAEKMPRTSFKKNQFDIIISSHLLFLYDHVFDYSFHEESIKEMFRIASKEVRIFPLVNLYGKKSNYLNEILEDIKFQDATMSIEKVNYEFIRGGNEFLRVMKNN